MVLPWIRAYAPRNTDEVVGQQEALARLKEYVRSYRPGMKPLLLTGPPGVGKTAAVTALAKELDREIVELNASDHRNKAAIESLLGAALHQRSLFFTGKIILVDEADGLSGTKDRGGVQALAKLVKESAHPIIATVNESDSKRVKPLKKLATVVEFHPLAPAELLPLLERIARAEGLETDREALTALARRSGGDARAAINDLQTLADGKRFTLDELDMLGDREQKERIEQALLKVFKTTKAEIALPAFDNVDADVDQLFLWIDANLPKAYTTPEDLAVAYDALAEADRFFGRIRRWQYYRFYVYIYNLLTAGIALAKQEKYPGAPRFKQSSRPLMIWMANARNAKRKAIAEKLAVATHTSAHRAYHEVPLLKGLAQQPAALDELQLSDDELAWLQS